MIQLFDAPASSLSLSQTSSDIQFGERNPALLRTDNANCWLRIEYSVRLIIMKLEQVVTLWKSILFQVAYGWTIFTCRPVFISLYKTHNPVEFTNEAYINFSKPVITYIYYASCFYFKPFMLNRAETELKCNTGIRKPYTMGILSYTDSWCLVPFST